MRRPFIPFVAVAPILVTAGLVQPRSASAQLYEGARLLSLAESQRALTTGNDSIYVNPAGLALAKVYSVELGYLDDIRGSDRRINASIVDSQAGPVAGGLAYTYSTRRPSDVPAGSPRIRGHRIEAATAMKIYENAAIGVTSRYLHYSTKDGDEELDSLKVFTFDVGLQWRIWEGISVGVVGYNLTNNKAKEVPIGWGAGLGFEYGGFSVEADVRYNAQIGKARYSGGAGYVIAGMVPLRIGTWYDLANKSWAISGGLGFVYERIEFDAGYRQLLLKDKTFDDEDDRILGISLRGRFF